MTPRRLKLYRIVTPGFVAGFLADERGKVVDCAPILRRWVRGNGGTVAAIRERLWANASLECLD